MKYLVTLLLLVFLPLTSAEIVVQQNTATQSDVFSVSGEGGLSIKASQDLLKTVIFIDGERIVSFDSWPAGQDYTLETGENGPHTVQINALVHQSYSWSEWNLDKDDYPLQWNYMTYDRDNKRIFFAIKGANIIHPNHIDQTAPSINEPFEGFTTLYNSQTALSCYPKVSTGKTLSFVCNVNSYPTSLNLELTIGITERYEVNVTGFEASSQTDHTEEPTSSTEEDQPLTGQDAPPQPDIDIPQDTTVIDNITLQDKIPEQSFGSDIIILLFVLGLIMVMFILYIESHHKAKMKGKKTVPEQKKEVKPAEGRLAQLYKEQQKK